MSEGAPLPHLLRRGARGEQLIVDGEPFLVLGGELGNSSASDPAEIPERTWAEVFGEEPEGSAGSDAEEFVIMGMGVVVTFAPADGRGRDGAWRGGRWLNGDQTHQGRHVRFPGDTWRVQRVRLYRYA